MPTSHLLLVSLGPIQDFIASARKCQDLWFGSWLLSDLARAAAAAMDGAAEGHGQSLVFPASTDRDAETGAPNVANKILVAIKNGASPKTVAEAGRAAMSKRLGEVAERAFRGLPEDTFHRAAALAQIGDLMEYVWVAAPQAEGSSGYRDARRAAETALAARKNTKVWTQVAPSGEPGGWSGKVPKSSLDGLRESVIDESAYDPRNRGAASLRSRFRVKRAERLCGVALLKRRGVELPDDDKAMRWEDQKPVFQSNSHVASTRTRLAVVGKAGPEWEAYVAHLTEWIDLTRFHVRLRPGAAATLPTHEHGFELDGVLLYESRLDDAFDEGIREGKAEGDVASAIAHARALLGNVIAKVGVPDAYFAMILADGDRMGAAIDALAEERAHRSLSAALVGFAGGCRPVVEAEHNGCLLYAGGDDVLALVPLESALRCARALEKHFSSSLDDACKALPKEARPTLSVGVAVAHHLEDMGRVRDLAKRAERLAKHSAGRNALGIVVDKRGGGIREAYGKWNAPDPLDARLEDYAQALADGILPHSVAFDVERAVAPLLVGTNAVDRGKLVGAAASLAKGALSRKSRGDKPIAPDRQKKMEAHLTTFEGIGELTRELQIAREFVGVTTETKRSEGGMTR